MPPGPREWTLGSHTFRFEPPDIFWVKFQGKLTAQEAKGAVAMHTSPGRGALAPAPARQRLSRELSSPHVPR